MSDAQISTPDADKHSFVMGLVPAKLIPYAQMMRLDRPIGWWLLLLPCWFSTLLGALYVGKPFWHFWLELVLFLIGAIIMRGAGCVINDIADHKFDAQVARTRSRPIPSGRVSLSQAYIFLGFLLLLGLLILLQFGLQTILVTLGSVIIVIIYPFAKRVTYWPQFVLGLAFNWGIWSGWSATTGEIGFIPLVLYIGCIGWTIGYDTIYAHQDKGDDLHIGVKSTALLFGANTKKYISLFYLGFWSLFGLVILLVLDRQPTLPGFTMLIAYVAFLASGLHLVWQLKVLDINNVDRCLMLFKSNRNFGLIVCVGLAISSLFI